MTVAETLRHKLTQALRPTYLEVLNESYKHNVPDGAESHFKLVVVSDEFVSKLPVARHKLIYGILDHELKNDIHALSMQLHTAEEWAASGGEVPDSPPCLGGSKFDK